MKKISLIFGLLVCVLFAGLLVSGCGPYYDQFPCSTSVVSPMPTYEGTDITITFEAGNSLGYIPSGKPIVAILKPKNMLMKNNRFYIGPGYTIEATEVPDTDRAVWDTFEFVQRLFLIDYPEAAELLRAGKYNWWIGKSSVPIEVPQDTAVQGLATAETGGAGEIPFLIFYGMTFSSGEPSAYKKAANAVLIDSNTDTVRGSGVNVGNALFGFLSISAFSDNKIYVGVKANGSEALFPWNARTIVVMNTNGNEDGVILTPREEWGTGFAGVVSIAAAGNKLYAATSYNSVVPKNADTALIRVYIEGSTAESYNYDITGLGICGPPMAARKVNSSTNKIYLWTSHSSILVLTDEAGTITAGEVPDPFESYHTDPPQGLWVVGNSGKYVVANENQFAVFDAADNRIALLTSEVDSPDVYEPSYAVDDPGRGRLYISQKVTIPYLLLGNKILVLNYGANPATLEAPIVFDSPSYSPIGSFAISSDHRMCVPVLDGRIATVNLDLPITNPGYHVPDYVILSGFKTPLSAAYMNGKFYVSDVGTFELTEADPFLPPEKWGYQATVINASTMIPTGRKIDIGYAPVVTAANGRLVGISHASSGYFVGLATTIATFESTEPPTIENVMINGGKIVNSDYISNNPILTADLRDNTAVWSAKVIFDGVEYPVTFNPLVPTSADETTRMTSIIGSVTGTGPHFITIEASDGDGVTVWEIGSLISTPEGASVMIRPNSLVTYPSVFKPLTGTPGPLGDATLRMAYELSVDANVTILIVDVTGKNLFTRKFSSATMGGRAGYNEITWNGRNDTGGVIGNGIYPYKILANGKVIAKGKIVVYE